MKKKIVILIFLGISVLIFLLANFAGYIFLQDKSGQKEPVAFYQQDIQIATGKTLSVKYFLGEPNSFMIDTSGASEDEKYAFKWAEEGIYATNASFFAPGSNGKPPQLSTLHIYDNKPMTEGKFEDLEKNIVKVNLGGNDNKVDLYRTEPDLDNTNAMDFIYFGSRNDKLPKVKIQEKTSYWSEEENLGITNMIWGIGGHNLLMSKHVKNEEDFLDRFKEHSKYGEYFTAINTNSECARTAIGYRNSDKRVVLAAIFGQGDTLTKGPTMYEVRLLMKKLKCTMALCLDGYDMTRISYKEGDTNTYTEWEENGEHKGRGSWCRIRLTETAAESVIWNDK